MPKKMKCAGIIPEHTQDNWRRIPIKDDDGNETYQMLNEPVTTPEHPCPNEPTMRRRNMKQVMCNLGEVHVVQDGEDELYCAGHFQFGALTALDGKQTRVPDLAI